MWGAEPPASPPAAVTRPERSTPTSLCRDNGTGVRGEVLLGRHNEGRQPPWSSRHSFIALDTVAGATPTAAANFACEGGGCSASFARR